MSKQRGDPKVGSLSRGSPVSLSVDLTNLVGCLLRPSGERTAGAGTEAPEAGGSRPLGRGRPQGVRDGRQGRWSYRGEEEKGTTKNNPTKNK